VSILILLIFIIGIDQLSKFYIQSVLALGKSVPVLPDIFHITYILNPGAAFGILEHQRLLFIVVATALLLGVLCFQNRLKKETLRMRLGVALLSGGAIGNLVDRIRLGAVVDFFDFRIWPIFNVADIAIVLGVGLIVWAAFLTTKEE
jgi:lipoprotein signal peptidase